jgi:hypothetical protein
VCGPQAVPHSWVECGPSAEAPGIIRWAPHLGGALSAGLVGVGGVRLRWLRADVHTPSISSALVGRRLT